MRKKSRLIPEENGRTRNRDATIAGEKTDPDANTFDDGREPFRHFVEELPVMVYALEPQPPYSPIYVSPAFSQFGYSLEEWRNDRDMWLRVIHPDDQKWVFKETKSSTRTGKDVEYEYRIIAADGAIHWVHDRGCLIRDENGTIIRRQGVIFDITAQKIADQELEKREKQYRTLARSIPRTAVLLFDHDLRYILADGEQLKRHNFSREMFENKTLGEVFPKEIADEWSGHYRRALAGEEVVIETDDDAGNFQIYVLPVRDENGKIFAGMVMWQDITERKKAEADFRESEIRYRTLFENANDVIYVHDLEGNYISINHAAERVFGYTHDEAMAMNMSRIVAPDKLDLVKANLAQKLDGRTRQTAYEVDCIRKDGTRLTLEVNSTAILKDGVPVAVQGIARDITDRKHAEEALRESEAKFRTLAETASDAIITIDEHGIISFVNAGTEKIFGHSAESMIGKNLTMLIPDRLREAHNNGLSGYLDSGKRNIPWKAVELPGLHKDGHELQLELSFAEYEKVGQRYFTSVIRDITERKLAQEAIMESESRFRDLFENANDLIYTHDLNGNFTSINRAGESITGFTREEAVKMNIAEVVPPDFLDAAKEMIAQKLAGGTSSSYELEIVAKCGKRVSLELSTRLIKRDGRPVGVQGIGRDITARKEAEQSLHNTVSLFASTFESTADGIIVMNHDRQIVTCNQKFREMWSVPDEIMAAKDGTKLVEFAVREVQNPEEFLSGLERLYCDPMATSTARIRLRDGRVYERYSQPQFMGGEPVGRVCCYRDITERETAEEKLRHYALHDTLTNLPNRVEFMNHLKRAIERTAGNTTARFAVLFLDLDRFKIINDSLGHIIGDKLLIAISERLKASIRPGDVVARLGGDEFTILLNRTGDLNEVAMIAERLQRQLGEPFKLDNYEVFTTASIGIIVSDALPREPEDFLRDADTAMYRAKEAGKARYEIFDREMHAHNMNVLQLETDLRHAIERSEFEVYYQPIVQLDGGGVREFEALIRWRHPVHGLVSPDIFIEVAEETGMIIPIGKWILEVACRQTSEWQRRSGAPLSISVNLSAKQLVHPHLTTQIKQILEETGLNSRQLKLEVTESTVMEHSERSMSVLSELAALGVSLSTDDFGTGYSSLSYLHKFPFSRLKIDRSFIHKMDSDEKSEAIVKTILMLGDNLDIEVVAEGIETEFQLHLLRSLGCRIGQGFLFSEPVNALAAGELLSNTLSLPTFENPIDLSGTMDVLEAQEIQ